MTIAAGKASSGSDGESGSRAPKKVGVAHRGARIGVEAGATKAAVPSDLRIAEIMLGGMLAVDLLDVRSIPVDVLVKGIRAGVPGATVKGFLDRHKIPAVSFADSIGMAHRTLARRLCGEVFKGDDAAKVVRFAKVFAMALDTFGSAEKANTWLGRPNRTLPGKATPASLLDTEFGAEEVSDSLLRIQHGVFA